MLGIDCANGLLTAPHDVAPHSLVEWRGGAPAEFVLRALAADDLAAEVARACGCVDDLDIADQLLDRLGDLLDRDALVAREVVNAVARDLTQSERDPVREVLDVHEPPGLTPVA